MLGLVMIYIIMRLLIRRMKNRALFHSLLLFCILPVLLLHYPGIAAGENPPGASTTPPAAKAPQGNKMPPLPPVEPRVIANGRRDIRKIALTFDACSTPKEGVFDGQVMDVLARMNVKATLFLGGKWMNDRKETVKTLAENPLLELGSHSYFHPHLPAATDERIREELLRTQKMMYRLTGKQPLLFRAPYGEYDDRVVRIAAGLGLTTIEYDLPSGDPDQHLSAKRLVRHVTDMAKNGSIVVMHINGRGWRTAEALPEIVEILRKKGFELVTVGELLEDLRNPADAGGSSASANDGR